MVTGKQRPPTPPDQKGPLLSWAMVQALVKAMNTEHRLWKEIEEARRVNRVEANKWAAKVDGYFPGSVWWARDAACDLFAKGRNAALTQLVERMGWDLTGRIAASEEVADKYSWPQEIDTILRRMNYIHYGFALWTLFTTPLVYRLRQCPECETFFIDMTRNRSGIYCGSECRKNHWNYAQRKVAGHTRFKSRKQR